MEEITVSTGIIFKTVDVPVMVFENVKGQMALKRPKVPKVWIENKGREESNPNDPDYKAAIEQWDAELNEKLIDTAIVLGTEQSEIPDGMDNVNGHSWLIKLKYLGVIVPEDDFGKYLAWVKYYAAPTMDDMQKLLLAACRNIGVTEKDVAESAALFRR